VSDTIRLEAELPAALAPRLARLPPLAARRVGRSRGQPVLLTWRDTAEGVLAEAGFAMEQSGRAAEAPVALMPGPHDRPALPPSAPDAARLPDQPLVAFAAFDGRRTILPLADGLEATLLSGRLRAVAAEQPVARLTLSGPAPEALALLRELAAIAPLQPPRASLAEAGRARARGQPVRPRRLGAPMLDAAQDLETALEALIGHLVDVLIWHAPIAEAGTDPSGVHQMRVAIRRLRSALRAFRPACDAPAVRAFDAAARDLAMLLGPVRDWDVFLAGLGAELAAALPEDRAIAALLRAAAARRQAAQRALQAGLQAPAFRDLLWRGVALCQERPWRAETDPEAEARRNRALADFGAAAIDKRWSHLVEAGAEIETLPDAEFHALRLDAKRLRYVAELFAPLFPRKRSRRFLARLAEVQEAFGLTNDAAVARALVRGLEGGAVRPWAVGVAEGWALARARRARRTATAAWAELLSTHIFWNHD
jgi:CHAD domain-containing protein